MPEHIRALVVLVFLSATVFAFAHKPAFELLGRADFTRRRNAWFAITLVAFFANNFWAYSLIAGALIVFSARRDSNPVALYFILLFCVPPLALGIPGLGLVNYLFALSHQRLLVLLIFVPAFIALLGGKASTPFGRTLPDKLLLSYALLTIVLSFRETTLTDSLRQAFYQFIDVFLPYYVISRSLKNTEHLRSALFCFLLAVMVLALVGLFETTRHWLLYNAVEDALGLHSRLSGYGERIGLTRAGASVGPIPLGFLMAVGIGFSLYLQHFIKPRWIGKAGFLLVFAGLGASLARGPWVGAALLFILFYLMGERPVSRLTRLAVIGMVALSVASLIPGGEKFTNLIPYLGDSGHGTISYRERLLENSLVVIGRNPWLGSIDFRETPEMESMRQGQGIIDIVNTYLGIALKSGYVGLSLFAGFFMAICWGIYRRLRLLPNKKSEDYLLGQALLSTLGAILLIIFTVSSVSVIPTVYWAVAGLGAAYINILSSLSGNQGKMTALHPSGPA